MSSHCLTAVIILSRYLTLYCLTWTQWGFDMSSASLHRNWSFSLILQERPDIIPRVQVEQVPLMSCVSPLSCEPIWNQSESVCIAQCYKVYSRHLVSLFASSPVFGWKLTSFLFVKGGDWSGNRRPTLGWNLGVKVSCFYLHAVLFACWLATHKSTFRNRMGVA